jgi:hypothetical protein
MKRKRLFVIVALVVIVLLIFGFAGRGPLKMFRINSFASLFYVTEDEPPIIVKNGSIGIYTPGEWQSTSAGWVNDAGDDKLNGLNLWVKATWTSGSCTAAGEPVIVTHTDNGVEAQFKTAFTFKYGFRTMVNPRGQIDQTDKHNLVRKTSAGEIKSVRATSKTCEIPSGSTNVVIAICSSASTAECQ